MIWVDFLLTFLLILWIIILDHFLDAFTTLKSRASGSKQIHFRNIPRIRTKISLSLYVTCYDAMW